MMNKLMVKQITCVIFSLVGLLVPVNIYAETEAQPDLDFLEFLADWQSDQGEWIDPLEVQDMAQNEHSLPSTEAQSDD